MTNYSQLLKNSAQEVRKFAATSPEAIHHDPTWIESLAVRIEAASLLTDTENQIRAIDAIAYSLRGSGPESGKLSPSFEKALDALQRSKKRK